MKSSSLFLKTAYQDCWDDYCRSLSLQSIPVWDFIVLTASNDDQAKGFEIQIEERRKQNRLPLNTRFLVIPDKGGVRVGSGGATLSVIREILKLEGKLDGLRILVIHSGGDSKRVPQYSALGKLFSPVPRKLPDGHLSTLFDEFLISMSPMASRIKEGMLLLSGDVLLLFNPLQVDFSGRDAACISFKENVSTGKNHGVYLNGTEGYVAKTLQKWPEDQLRQIGAVDSRDMVDIDTGAVVFSTDILKSLSTLAATDELYDKYVNETVRLSLYADFLFPLAQQSSLEDFLMEKPEGTMCDELLEARKEVWGLLSKYKMKLLRLAPARFIHFGTSKEILSLMNGGISEFAELGWSENVGSSASGVSSYNSVVKTNAKIGTGCYFESSYVHGSGTVGNNVILSSIDIHDEIIPDDVVVHGLKLKDGRFVVRMFGVNENPKEKVLFGREFDTPIWSTPLFEVKNSIKEALESTLRLYSDIKSGCEIDLSGERLSLADGFSMADPNAIVEWNTKLSDLVKMNDVSMLIDEKKDVKYVHEIGFDKELTKAQKQWLENELSNSPFSKRIRLYYYLGVALNDDSLIGEAFKEISKEVLEASKDDIKYNESLRIVKDSVKVNMPLRVNFGGGWSDTSPYANENGGCVLNAAISLNGELPVEVKIDRISEKKIVFISKDMDVYKEFDSIEDLQDTGNPYDSCALQKAALIAVGLIPAEGSALPDILDRIGGGFVMQSEVTNVPKGSGLGTSSILSAAVVKALYGFFGIEGDVFQTVLVMEQIMSTGGGWQDQVGGAIPGFKLITSEPGQHQELKVERLDIKPETIKELEDRFCLIYTGQRRLARNLLRDVVGRYIGNVPESVEAHRQIKEIAVKMKERLLKGDVDEFVRLYALHYEKSLEIDSGSTNSLIDAIFESVSDLIDAKMVVGAGGGGFVSVFTKKGITRKEIESRLKETFLDFPIGTWEKQFI